MPQISIIIPVYKAEKYLRQCLDSVKSQTFTDWECILVDDGSPDNSGLICDEYAAQDHRFRVFHKENGGVSSARNLGLEKSIASWITFVDADDLLKTTYLKDLNSYQNTEMVVTGIKRTGTKNDEIKYPSSQEYKISELSNLWNVPLKAFPFWWCWGKLFKKDIIDRYNIKFRNDMFYSEDTLFVFNYIKFITSLSTTETIGYIHYSEPNRPQKYKMNFEQLDNHVDSLLTATKEIETLSSTKFVKIKDSIMRRFYTNYLVNLFNTDHLKEFKYNQNKLYSRYYYKDMCKSFYTNSIGKIHKRRYLIHFCLKKQMLWLAYLLRHKLYKDVISNTY